MKLTLIDGKVFDEEGNERVELTSAEQDYIISILYPDGEVQTMADISRHRSSYGGVLGLDINRFASYAAPYVDNDDCLLPERMELWGKICGGRDGALRLRTLYCNKFHLYATATDLGIPYETIVKWFQRWRVKAKTLGLTPEALFVQ